MAFVYGSIRKSRGLLETNGARKTTILKTISGLLKSEDGRVTSGSIVYKGQPIHNREPEEAVEIGLVQVLEG